MNNLFLRDLCAALVLSFGHFLWIGTLIAVVAAVSAKRQKTAEARYRSWLGGLIAMAASPFIALVVLMAMPSAVTSVEGASAASAMNTAEQPARTAGNNLADGNDEARRMGTPARPLANDNRPSIANEDGRAGVPILQGNRAPNGSAEQPPLAADAPQREPAWWREYAPVVTSLYLIGVALMGLRLAFGLWGGRRLRNQATLITDRSLLDALQRQADALGMTLVPALAYCERVAVPTVLGILKPMILLPVSVASGLAPDQIESVLAHELAHLRRCDHLVNLMQCVIESVLFFHPAVWWVSRRIRDEREHCCDDLVIACGAVPLDYAASLLRVAELSREAEQQRGHTQRQSFAAVSLFATGDRPSTLRQRIARLLGDSTDTHVRFRNRWPVIFICITCVLLASMALQIGVQSAADADVQTQFVAKLPDNVTVELIGVTHHTSTSKPEPGWWTPSGSPLAQGPDVSNEFRGKAAPENHRVFVVKVRGVSEASDVRVSISSARKEGNSFSSWGSTFKDVGKTDATNVTSAGPFIKANQTSVRVRLATDDWGPIQVVSVSATRINKLQLQPEYAKCYDNIGPQRVGEHSSRAALTIGWPRNQDDLATFEVWAVDKDGKRHEVSGTAGPSGGREFSFNLPLTQIARFEYRLRPYRHWVTFENVSLQPRQKTDVKVSTTSLPLPRPDKYVAELPDGLKVEFVGLAEMGKEDKNWWKPDGVALDQVPAHKFNGTTTVSGQEMRRALIRVHGAKSYLDVTTNMTGERTDEATGSGGPYVSFDGALGFTRPQTTARVEVGVATQPLSPVRRIDPTGKRLPKEADAPVDHIAEDIKIISVAHPRLRALGDSKINGKPVPLTPDEVAENDKRRQQSEITFLPPLPLNRLDFQLTLIDIDGQTHWRNSSSFHFEKPEVAYTFDLPLARVARFEYRLRPHQHWVTFENVSLHPNKMTDVKVSVASLPQPKPDRYIADLPDGMKVEFVGVTKNTAPAKDGWKPDGLPIGEVGYWPATIYRSGNTIGRFNENGEHPEPNTGALDLLFRFRGLKAQPSFAFDLAGTCVGASHDPVKDPYELRVTTERRSPLPGGKWTIPDGEMRVGLTDEPWGRYVKISLEGKTLDPIQPDERYASTYGLIEVLGTRPHDRAPTGNTIVLRRPLTDADSNADEGSTDLLHRFAFEFRAIDTDGKNHWADPWFYGQISNTKLMESLYGLMQPLPAGATLSHYEYRLRPYRHWVTFTGVSLEPGKESDVKVSVVTLPNEPLEFLKPYPKLHGLSLDMTEPQFLEIVQQQELKTKKTGEGDKTAYHMGLGDGLTLIVMFRQDGTCRGIQRIRGEDAVDETPSSD